MRNKIWRTIGMAGMAGVLIWTANSAVLPPRVVAAETAQAHYQITLMSESIVTSGAILKTYEFRMPRKDGFATAIAKVIEVDLTNPNVKLDLMTGDNGKLTERETVLSMTKDTGAVAGVNGDYYATSGEYSPIGPSIQNGTLVTSPDNNQGTGMYAFGLTKSNHPIIDYYTFDGKITAPTGETIPIAGVNKSVYWYNVNGKATHSHANKVYMYTSAWNSTNRGNDGASTPTEVLVRGGKVAEISVKKALSILVPEDGYILRASGAAADFLTKNFKVGDTLPLQTRFVSTNPQNPLNYTDFKMMVGGHTLLVENGQPSGFTRDVSTIGGDRSRTAIGYNKDRTKAMLIAVNKNDASTGMTLGELQKFMVQAGVHKGLNLDGGGSTQVVSRTLGEFQPVLANPTEYGTQRQIVNSVGVYSTAPKGDVKGFLVNGSPVLFIGESATYTFRAYDTYYNPVDVSSLPANWSLTKGTGTVSGSTFTPSQAGESVLTVQSGKAIENKSIRVIGATDLNRMSIDANYGVLTQGSSFKLPVYATTTDGLERQVPASLINWEFIGFKGRMDGDVLHVEQVGSHPVGHAIARYDGYSTIVTLATGMTKKWSDFTNPNFTITPKVSPNEVKGAARVATGFSDDPNNAVLFIEYNFSMGTGTKAVYAALNDDKGVAIEGKPMQMELRLRGDNSLNWVRAEIVDAKGTKHLVSITENLNWYDWKTIAVDLTTYKMAYPITLKRFYVANPEQGQDEREAIGNISIDDVSFQYQGQLPVQTNPKVKLVLNQQTMWIDGVENQMDSAPTLYQNTTMVPIKFIVQALGGQVWWDQSEKKVSILRGDQYAELWVGKNDFIVNGVRGTATIPPMVEKGRTLVPLRLISETLGWKVIWNQDEKSVMLE